MFSKYYQDELAYLRELGKEFAQTYPALAPMLADRGADPDVERLLEGVAFLTGRIREKLDDELPELTIALASLLFPQLVRPLPGTTILELTAVPNALRQRHLVPAGTEFGSAEVSGTTCRFRSTTDCELVPWQIQEVRLESLASGGQQLRIDLHVPMGSPIAPIAPSNLRLHLAGDERTSLLLSMWILTHTEQVALIAPDGHESLLGKESVHAVGYDSEESLLPFGRAAFAGFRLLSEYYVLPAKFSFVDIRNIRRIEQLDAETSRISLAIRFDAPLPTSTRITKDSVKLHCVPVVNIFATTAEPIRLSAKRGQYVVRPAGLPPGHGEVYAITRVEAVSLGTGTRTEIPSFFDFSHAEAMSRPGQPFYTTHMRPAVVDAGVDVLISFGTAENTKVLLDADVASIDLLATNRRIANSLRVGEINVATASSPAIATFRNLSTVSPHVPPPFGRELHWRVIAHAAMGLRALTDPEVLRAALNVYNLHAIVDRQVARANELRVAAVKDVRVRPAERLYRGAPIRGVAIEIDLDESGFTGDGDMYLFGAILDRFFGAYVPINSFSVTTVHGVQTNAQYTWPARSGNLTIP